MAHAITAHTALLGVLGHPVGHSLSPALHNAAIGQLGLDWVYLALPVPAEKLATVVQGLETVGCRGLSVTIPHKQSVAGLCRQLSPLAERLGAVNTLVPRPQGGWLGTNTDVEGFVTPLRHQTWQGRRALVLGNGGSARAVVAGLVDLGLEAITVLGRRPEALETFAADCRAWAPQLNTQTLDRPIEPLLAAADLVVNTTPVGMAAAGDGAAAARCPLAAADLEALRPATVVYDLIYTPRPTLLLEQAAARGCPVLDGLEMLVGQGAAALRLWSGQAEVPVAAMRRAALAQLGAA